MIWELETTIDGVHWSRERFKSIADYRGEPYAISIGVFIVSFYTSRSSAERARETLDNQMYIIGHLARLFGYGPVVIRVRNVVNNIEVTSEDYYADN